MTLFAPLAPAAAINPGDLDTTFDTNGSINVKELFRQHVNVEKIKTDSDNGTVVLASFYDAENVDNHILFRLNADGSYDNSFGDPGLSLNGKNYILVAETGFCYTHERVDLEIDSLGRMLVMLSGSGNCGDYEPQAFVKRYLQNGDYDDEFGDEGTVDLVFLQEAEGISLSDLSLDNPVTAGGFLVAGYSYSYMNLALLILKFDDEGQFVLAFGEGGGVGIETEFNFSTINSGLAEDTYADVNSVRVIPDNSGGYLIAYTGFYETMDLPFSIPTTGLVRLLPNGLQDPDFAAGEPLPNDFLLAEFDENQILLPFFIFTDIFPDGQESFLISGTTFQVLLLSSPLIFSLLFRLDIQGNLDSEFDVSARIDGLNYNLSTPNPDDDINTEGVDECYNLALFRNENPNKPSTAIIVGDLCEGGGFYNSSQSALLGFSHIGELDQNFGEEGFVGLPNLDDDGEFSSIITQLEPTKDGKLLVLRGAEPTSGLIAFLGRAGFGSIDTSDGVVTISRYNLSQSVPAFTLTQATETATVGTAITSPIYSITPTVGSFNRYAVSPSLPTGITFDTSTALIAGTPQVSTGLVTYTVTGFTNINETATATFGLRVLAAPSSCANGGVCQVGDTGPGGGIVFYVAPTTFTQPGATISMCSTWCKYLEAAPSTWSSSSGDPTRKWVGPNYETSRIFEDWLNTFLGTDGVSIGSGYQNSEYLRGTDSSTTANSAAALARAYTGGGKSDWYLPAKNELDPLYAQRAIVGGISDARNYWSSTESNDLEAWYLYTAYSNQPSVSNTALKTDATLFVRPIRAFGTGPSAISIPNVAIPAPVRGATPASSITSNGQFTTGITWSGSPSVFDSSTAYTATVTVTPVAGYTLNGVDTNFFTVNGSAPTSVVSPIAASLLGTTGVNPIGITVDSSGNVYTANFTDNNVTKITPQGVTTIFGTTGLQPTDIAIDGSGNIYTSNLGSNNVTKITPSGVSTPFANTGLGPSGIAIDSAGNVYTANASGNSVTKITPSGGVTNIPCAPCVAPRKIAVDHLGNIFTTNFGNNSADKNVTKITSTGVSTIFGTVGGTPWGIAVDALGNVYVSNFADDTVTKILPNGDSAILGRTGGLPWGVAVDSAGNVYTANATNGSTNAKVTKISPQGIASTLLPYPAYIATEDIAVDSLGNVYVGNSGNSVVKLAPTNSGVFTYGFPATAAPTAAPVVVYVAPTPVPYLKTLTKPKLNLKDGKLICTPGTYNAGYTLDGVVQGSGTTLFTPSSFTYNLLINGITQTSLAVTSSNTSAPWNIPASAAGALVTCSVTVSANGVTNTDKSSDNSSGVSTSLSTQTSAITTANAEYSAAVSANTKTYQKALVDNRAKWRSDTEKIRTDYYAERDRIKSLPSTKTTRAQASAALKAYTAAQKKSAADYKASGPAALAAKDVADKAALTAREAAIAKANAAYGTAIESIGYGVLIP